MKKEETLLEQFDHLGSIEPSAKWNEHLLLRMNQQRMSSTAPSGTKWVFLAMVLLLVINLFSLSKSWRTELSRENEINLKRIANEYLISTNSSKF